MLPNLPIANITISKYKGQYNYNNPLSTVLMMYDTPKTLYFASKCFVVTIQYSIVIYPDLMTKKLQVIASAINIFTYMLQ